MSSGVARNGVSTITVMGVLSVGCLDHQVGPEETAGPAPGDVASFPGGLVDLLQVRAREGPHVLQAQAGSKFRGAPGSSSPDSCPAVASPVLEALLARVAQQAPLPSVPFHLGYVFRVQQVEVGRRAGRSSGGTG